MVSQGLALAYRQYSLDYVGEEVDAQVARRGIWAAEFVKPWEWRRGKRLDALGSTWEPRVGDVHHSSAISPMAPKKLKNSLSGDKTM